DGDGQFDDATGVTPTVSSATLATLGLADGPSTHTVAVQVTEGPSVDTATATLTIRNVAPVVAVLNVPPGTVAGTAVGVTFGATHPAPVDAAAGFTYAVDWRDGTPVQSLTGGSTLTANHTYATAGTFTISVTATDKDGGTSAAASASIDVAPFVVADAGG